MTNRERVANDVDQGYQFKNLDHNHWDKKIPIQNYISFSILFIVPTLIIFSAYTTFRDMIVSQLIYQITIFILPLLLRFVNLLEIKIDLLYIYPLSDIVRQKEKGIKHMIWIIIFFSFVIPFGISFLTQMFYEDMKFLIPSGLIEKSTLQKTIHYAYFIILIIEFCIIQPVLEIRYYFILILQQNPNSFILKLLIFIMMNLNNLYVFIFFMENNTLFGIILVALTVISNYRLIRHHSIYGVFYNFIWQAGINITVVVFIILFISSVFKKNPHDLSFYATRNAFDFSFDIFVDDVEL